MCLVIGAYSKWLDAAPNGLSVLPQLIDILVSGMSVSEDTAAAAALAFRHICGGKHFCLIAPCFCYSLNCKTFPADMSYFFNSAMIDIISCFLFLMEVLM